MAGKRKRRVKFAQLSKRERDRYSRNMLIKEWGGEVGQLALKNSTVLVVGAGGSGSTLLYYLAAAGVGTIRVCDGDVVNVNNLNRQILHDERRLGKKKARSACTTLEHLNPDIEVVAFPYYMSAENIGELAGGCDLICCAADDRNDRIAFKIIDRYAFEKQVPVAWGGGVYMGGFVTFILPPTTPCMECFLAYSDAGIEAIRSGKMVKSEDAVLPSDGPNPIVGAAAGAAGAMQAMEAIKYLVGFGTNLWGVVLSFQMGKGMVFNQYDIDGVRRPSCPYCGVNNPSRSPPPR